MGSGSNSNFVASEDRPQYAVRDPHNPVLQSAGTPGDCGVLNEQCHTLGEDSSWWSLDGMEVPGQLMCGGSVLGHLCLCVARWVLGTDLSSQSSALPWSPHHARMHRGGM